MGRFVLRRVLGMVAVLFAISVFTFLIFNVIPNGDPAYRIAGRNATPTQIAQIREQFGLDRSKPVQYAKMMQQVFSGSLVSYSTQTNVVDEIERDLPHTFSLAIGAALIWMTCAVALGLFTAMRAGRLSDRLLTILALVGVSMPVFWLGALVSYELGFKAGIFPFQGYVKLTEDPVGWAYHLILPWLVLSALFIGLYSRVLRSNVLDTMNEDHVRTARAKGLTERQVLTRHVLRTSLIPIVSLWGLDFGAVLGGGAILTESVFQLGGVGQYAADSIGSLDVPPVLAITLFGAFFIVLLSAVVDVIYAWLDPRIRVA